LAQIEEREQLSDILYFAGVRLEAFKSVTALASPAFTTLALEVTHQQSELYDFSHSDPESMIRDTIFVKLLLMILLNDKLSKTSLNYPGNFHSKIWPIHVLPPCPRIP
jgi:hypothetical protein